MKCLLFQCTVCERALLRENGIMLCHAKRAQTDKRT